VKVGAVVFLVPKLSLAAGTPVSFSLRPEALLPLVDGQSPPEGWATVSAKLTRLEFLGALTRLEASIGDGAVLRSAVLDAPLARLKLGDTLRFAYDPQRITVFPNA
jgi:iron(III) transport system ATP-binding protein/putative spermidine/putrescine transport system ATP-binding protein